MTRLVSFLTHTYLGQEVSSLHRGRHAYCSSRFDLASPLHSLKMVSLAEPTPGSDSFHPIDRKTTNSVNSANVKNNYCQNLTFSDSVNRNRKFNNSLLFDSHQVFCDLQWLVQTCLCPWSSMPINLLHIHKYI